MVARIDVRTRVHELMHGLYLPGRRGDHERRPSALVLCVYLRMMGEKGLEDREVVCHGRPVERRASVLGRVSEGYGAEQARGLTASVLLTMAGSWERRERTRPVWPSCAVRCMLNEDMVCGCGERMISGRHVRFLHYSIHHQPRRDRQTQIRAK